MRKFVLFALMAIFVVGFAVSSNAQDKTVIAASPQAVRLLFDVLPDSPLQLSMPKKTLERSPSVFEIQNLGDRPVRAFVLENLQDEQKSLRIWIWPNDPIEKGKPILHGATIVGERRETVKDISLSLDYVEFTDGGSWGADSYGLAKPIAAFMEGRDLAMSRLLDYLYAESMDPNDFLASIRINGGYALFTEPRSLAGYTSHDKMRLAGYSNIITSLRSMKERVAEAKELAQKLEDADKSIGRE